MVELATSPTIIHLLFHFNPKKKSLHGNKKEKKLTCCTETPGSSWNYIKYYNSIINYNARREYKLL